MMAMSDTEKREVIEEVIQKMDEIAEALRQLDDPQIRYYVLPHFEGQNGGWLGEFARDVLQHKLGAYLQGLNEDQ
jgi:hypothetical protein